MNLLTPASIPDQGRHQPIPHNRSREGSPLAPVKPLDRLLQPTVGTHCSMMGSFIFLLVLLLLSSCTPETRIATNQPTATLPSTVTLAPTSTPLPPTPTPPSLGLVPSDCPPSSPSETISPAIGPAVGGSPVWAIGIAPGPIHIPSYFTYTQYGWTWKVAWEIGPNYTNLVTLRGGNIRDGTPLWFQVADQDASTSPVLDPQHPQRGSAIGPNWAEWGSYLYIPAAGCYYLEATWPGGHWRVNFAAGR
jgi:hypothetical protein